jgi:hypothetical protein
MTTEPNAFIETMMAHKSYFKTLPAPASVRADSLISQEGNGMDIEGSLIQFTGALFSMKWVMYPDENGLLINFIQTWHAFVAGGDPFPLRTRHLQSS